MPMMMNSSRGFTLIELLAVVTIVLVLAALLLPATSNFIARANGAKCMANLKTIGAMSATYSADHNGDWPPCGVSGPVFADALIPYLGSIPKVNDANFMSSPLICPGKKPNVPEGNYRHRGVYTATYVDPSTGNRFKYGLSYGQNVYTEGAGSAGVPKRVLCESPSQMMLYMDLEEHHIVSTGGLAVPDRRENLLQRHNGMLNVAFADGSVRNMTFKDIPPTNVPMRQFWSGKGKTWPD